MAGARLLAVAALLCGAAASADPAGAAGAARRPTRHAAPPPKAVPPAYVPASKPSHPPPAPVQPEVSEGQWGKPVSGAELTAQDLVGASVGLSAGEENLETARKDNLRQRNLQDAPALATSALDRAPNDPAPLRPDAPDLSNLNLRVLPGRN